MKTTNKTDNTEMNFDQIFKQISLEEILEIKFDFVGEGFPIKGFPIITAGKVDHYNAMTGSGGGMGLLIKKPTTWCVLRADRYTFELMEKEQTYTLSYFPNEYKEQVIFLGSRSGRDSEKMKEVKLTAVQTPTGNMSFEEAGLIIECRLTQASTIKSDDFYAQEVKDYVDEAYEEAKVYRKYVFGEITHIWVKKEG